MTNPDHRTLWERPDNDNYEWGGGRWHYGQDVPRGLLDAMLMGGNNGAAGMAVLPSLESQLYRLPLPVLQMFRPFTFGTTDADWDNIDSAVAAIIRTFQPKTFKDWIAEFELKTGLNIDEGIDKFIASVIVALEPAFAKHREWVAEFEASTGLNIDEGIVKFLESLMESLKRHHLDWVSDFESKTGLNIDEGPQKFFESVNAQLQARHLDWVTDFEAKTGLNIDAGAAAFLTSLIALLQSKFDEAQRAWIADFEAKSGLNIDEGAAKFLQSLITKLQPNFDAKADRDAWIADFEAKTGLNIDEGATKFLQSLIIKLQPNFDAKADRDAWIADFEAKTGLNIDAGTAAFVTSLIAVLQTKFDEIQKAWVADFEAKTGLNIDAGLAAFLLSIKNLLRPEWMKDDAAWIADFEAKTGLNIDAGVPAFLTSLIALLQPKLTEAQTAWIADFEAKTGLDVDAGPAAFLTSLGTLLQPKLTAAQTAWIADFEAKSGLNIDEGPAKFLQSLITLLGFKTLADSVQDLIDGIADAADGTTATNRPVLDAINAFKAMLQTASAANAAATNAQIGVAALKAAQAGGFSDEFDYPVATKLPNTYTSFKLNAAHGYWAPDGKGILNWRPLLGFEQREILRRDTNPLVGSAGSMTVVISKPPATDVVNRQSGAVFVCVQMSATDQSCWRVRATPTTAYLEKVDGQGRPTQTATATLPAPLAAGQQLEVRYTASTIEFRVDGLTVMNTAYTPLAGQLVGFGGYCPTYGVIGNIAGIFPAPEFAGIAWHP